MNESVNQTNNQIIYLNIYQSINLVVSAHPSMPLDAFYKKYPFGQSYTKYVMITLWIPANPGQPMVMWPLVDVYEMITVALVDALGGCQVETLLKR